MYGWPGLRLTAAVLIAASFFSAEAAARYVQTVPSMAASRLDLTSDRPVSTSRRPLPVSSRGPSQPHRRRDVRLCNVNVALLVWRRSDQGRIRMTPDDCGSPLTCR